MPDNTIICWNGIYVTYNLKFYIKLDLVFNGCVDDVKLATVWCQSARIVSWRIKCELRANERYVTYCLVDNLNGIANSTLENTEV